MDKPDLTQLPSFVKGHRTYRAIVEVDSETDPIDLQYPNAVEDVPQNSNLIGSHCGTYSYGKERMHRPMLDLDFPAKLVPSTTPGHSHLYIDVAVHEVAYEKMLSAMVDAGLIQYGFYQSFLRNRQTTLRLPGVKKCGEFESNIAKGLGANLLTKDKTYTELMKMRDAIDKAIEASLDPF